MTVTTMLLNTDWKMLPSVTAAIQLLHAISCKRGINVEEVSSCGFIDTLMAR